MISLDMPTILFSSLLTEIVSTFVIVLLWLQNRKRFKGITLWVINFCFQTIALLLIILRGQISDWLSIDLSNIMVIAGSLLGLMGLEKFIGKRNRHLHNYFILVLFAFIQIWFTYVKPDLGVRTMNVSLGMVIMFSQCSWLLLHDVPGDAKRIGFLTGIVFFIYSFINIVRIIDFFIARPTETDYFNSSIFETSVLISFQILFILLTYSLVLMYNRRLLYDIVAQEEKYSKAFRSSPYAIILTRFSDGKIIEVNDKFFEITGYLPDEVINKSTLEIKIWDTDDNRLAVVEALSKIGKVHDLEFQFRKKSGGRFPGIISCEILTVDSGGCILTSINDISIRKKAENEIKLNEARLEGLLRISQHKAKTVREYLDFALYEVLKLTSSQLGNIYYYSDEKKEFILSSWSKKMIESGQIVEQQTVYPIEITGLWEEAVRQRKPVIINDLHAENSLKKDLRLGQEPVSNLLALPVFIDNQIVAVVVVANKETSYIETDVKQLELIMNSVWHITEQIKAESSLKETQAILKAAMDCSQAGIAIADAPSGLLRYVNNAGRLIRNKSEEEIVNELDINKYVSSWQIKHLDGTPYKPDEVPFVRAVMYGEATSREFIISLDNNDDRIVFANAAPVFDNEGKIKAGIVVFLDVTESKRALQAIKVSEEKFRKLNEDLENRVSTRTAQLVAANKELEAFSYSVSHDLRAPLRAIHSFANILAEDYEENLDAEGRRIADIIKSSSVHMGKLIDDLLEFSRTGRSGMNYSSINMTHLVRSVYQELTQEKEKGRVIFLVHKLPSISGDNILIKQVVRNLISNALKYTSKNKIAEIEIGSEINGDETIYWVKDNGVGFDMQYMKKLFGVFQRLHSTREFEGNGVGLAIVKRIILRHDGRVWAEGEVNKGARFYFALPGK